MSFQLRTQNFGGYPASADYSTAGQHRFVVIATAAVTLAGDGALAHGVLQNDPASGEPAEVALLGTIIKVEAGAAVSVNANVASDANGRAVTATTGEVINGRALEAASAAGELIAVLTFTGGAGTAA